VNKEKTAIHLGQEQRTLLITLLPDQTVDL
jgi:hypothetical protein